MVEALTAAKSYRGTVRASVTKLEARIIIREDRLELPASKHLSVQCCIEMLKE